MSTALAPFTTTELVANEDIATAIGNSIQDATEESGDATLYLRVNQAGSEYAGQLTFGAESSLIDTDSEWAFDTRNIHHGWVARSEKGKILGASYVPLHETLPKRPEGGKVSVAYRGILRCVSAHHMGTQVEFSGASGYHRRFFKNLLLPAIQTQVRKVTAQGNIYPVMRLVVESYESKDYGKTFYNLRPEIVEWVDSDLERGDTTPPPAPTKRRARPRVIADGDIPA